MLFVRGGRAQFERDMLTAAVSKWDTYYASCDLETINAPWDSGQPCSQLVALLEARDVAATHVLAGPPRTALDLGCGTGASVCYLAQQGWKATGVDICERAIELARRRWQQQQQQQQESTGTGCGGGGVGDVADGNSDGDLAAGNLDVPPPAFECADFFAWARQQQQGSLRRSQVLSDAAGGDTTAANDDDDWRFDLVVDCQFFHALWDGTNGSSLARVIAECVAPGGHLLLLTGSTDDVRDCGPTRLSALQLLSAFLGEF